MKKTLALFLVLTIICSLPIAGSARWILSPEGYGELYLEYAEKLDDEYKDADDVTSAQSDRVIILMDIDGDTVPEFMDADITTKDYDAYEIKKMYVHRAAYIRDEKVLEQKLDIDNMSPDMLFLKNIKTEKPEIHTRYLDIEQGWTNHFKHITFDIEKGFSVKSMSFSADESQERYDYEKEHIDSHTAVNDVYVIEKVGDSYRETMQFLLRKFELKVSDFAEGTVLSQDTVSPWAWADIDEAKELGIIPEEMYGLNLTRNINRAEVAAIAYKLACILASYEYEMQTGNFEDIEGNVYEDYIEGAASLGITQGTGSKDGKKLFSPDLKLTREQLATMLCRTIKAVKEWEEGIEIELNSSGAPEFEDSYLISDYARDSVDFLAKHGIMRGVDDYNIAPLDTATREQAILLALRIYNAYDVLSGDCSKDTELVLSDKEILEDLEGIYVYSKYMEVFQKTRSAVDASEYGFIIKVYKDGDYYTAQPGDFHQGSYPFGAVDTIEHKDGQYCVTSRPHSFEHVGDGWKKRTFTVLCYPKKYGYVSLFKLSEQVPGWLETDGYVSMYPYSEEEMSRLLFEDVEGVEMRRDGAYGIVNGKLYRMVPSSDTTQDSDFQLEDYDGFMWLYPEGEDVVEPGKGEYAKYRYENGKVTVVAYGDDRQNVFGE